MVITFISPMGTEKRSRELSIGLVLHSSEKRSAGRGRDGKRPFGRRTSETVFCKWTQLLPHYWRERVRFLVYNAVKCDVGCIDREEGPDVFGFRRAFLVITLSPLFTLCKMPFG